MACDIVNSLFYVCNITQILNEATIKLIGIIDLSDKISEIIRVDLIGYYCIEKVNTKFIFGPFISSNSDTITFVYAKDFTRFFTRETIVGHVITTLSKNYVI